MRFTQEQFERLSQLMADKGVRHEAFELLADLRMSERIFAEKAQAYDRLMSGGRKTLKEIANFLQRPIAIQPSRSGGIAIFANVPFLGETEWKGHWMFTIVCDFDYTGDWKDSLTLPDGWEDAK